MKKKVLLFLMILAVLSVLYVGCGENSEETNSSDNTTGLTYPTLATETDATIPGGHVITYSEFEQLNGEQQKNVISKFESKEQFDTWYEEIKEDYKVYVENVKPSEIVNPSTETKGNDITGSTNPSENVNPGTESEGNGAIGNTNPSEVAKPTTGNDDVTDPSQTEGTILPTPTDVTVPDKDEITFMDYHEMSGDEQLAFINSFSSYSAFAAWHAAARDAYNETMIEIDGTDPIDLGDLFGKGDD